MEQIAINWRFFGITLAGAFIFGVFFSLIVHLASRRNMVGQTAWMVVVGVTFTLLIMIPVFGLNRVAIMFCYFGASGIPMIIEYILRVQDEIQADKKKANGLAKDLLK